MASAICKCIKLQKVVCQRILDIYGLCMVLHALAAGCRSCFSFRVQCCHALGVLYRIFAPIAVFKKGSQLKTLGHLWMLCFRDRLGMTLSN